VQINTASVARIIVVLICLKRHKKVVIVAAKINDS